MTKFLLIFLLIGFSSYAQYEDEPSEEYEEDIEAVDPIDYDDIEVDDSPYAKGNGHGSGSDCPPHSACWCAENPKRCKDGDLPAAPVMPAWMMATLAVSGTILIFKVLKPKI